MQQRRDTIAYMPRSVEGLKFADELEDLDETTAVWMMSNDRNIEEQFFDPIGSAQNSNGEISDVDWNKAIRFRSNPNTFIPFLPYLFHTNN